MPQNNDTIASHGKYKILFWFHPLFTQIYSILETPVCMSIANYFTDLAAASLLALPNSNSITVVVDAGFKHDYASIKSLILLYNHTNARENFLKLL